MSGFFRDDYSRISYQLAVVHASVSINEELLRVIVNSCTVGHWASNFDHFKKGLEYGEKKIDILLRNVIVEQSELVEALNSLVNELENAEETVNHIGLESYESDLRCYRNSLQVVINKLKKVIEYKPPVKKGGDATITIVRVDGSIETHKVERCKDRGMNDQKIR